MCTPNTFSAITPLGIFNTATSVVSGISNIKNEKRNLKYKTQIAINNAKAANNEALRQNQLGIEQARKEKIEGIKNMKTQMAKNASNGFDMNSNTNLQSYQDTINNANSNAETIKNDYSFKADSYFDKARDYLGNIKQYRNDYNSSVFQTALGGAQKVANSWFKKER